MLVIPYSENTFQALGLVSFTTSITSVYRGDLQNKTAGIAVAWRIDNRLPNTNLVFEQIISTNEAINIELPRHELWIPSIGQGVLAPTFSADKEITIRLQVVDMLNDEVYAERTLSVSVIPGNSTPPTSYACPDSYTASKRPT